MMCMCVCLTLCTCRFKHVFPLSLFVFVCVHCSTSVPFHSLFPLLKLYMQHASVSFPPSPSASFFAQITLLIQTIATACGKKCNGELFTTGSGEAFMLFIIVIGIIIIWWRFCANVHVDFVCKNQRAFSSASGDQRKSYEITTNFHLIIIIFAFPFSISCSPIHHSSISILSIPHCTPLVLRPIV